MRPITVRRLGSAAAAVAAGLAATVLAGCGSSPAVPGARSTVPTPALVGGPVVSAITGPASAAPSACSLLRPADVLAVAATFRGAAISIDGHNQASQPPLGKCGFNQKGVFASADGMVTTLSGDQWAQLTVVADGNDIGDYSPDGP